MRRFDSRALGLLLLIAPSAGAQLPAPAVSPAPLQRPAAAPPRATPAPEPTPAPAAAAASRAAAPGAEPIVDTEPMRLPAAAIPQLAAWLGAGSVWIPSDGLDTFAEDDALVMFSAGASFGLAGDDALSVAAVGAFDATASETTVRGDASSLGLMRLALGPELRGSIVPRLFWHGRLSPTLARLSAELGDASSVTLVDNRWVWGAEAAAGLDFRFAEVATALPAALGFFVRVEGGYAWSPATALSLEAEGSGAPVRTQALEAGEIALAGPLLRVSLGLGY